MDKKYVSYMVSCVCHKPVKPLEIWGITEVILYNPTPERCQTVMTAYFENRPPYTFAPIEVAPERNMLLVMPNLDPAVFTDCGFWGARFESTTPLVVDQIEGFYLEHPDDTFKGGCTNVLGMKLHKEWHFADGFWLEHKRNLKGDIAKAPFPFNEIEYYYFLNPGSRDAKVDMTLRFRRIEHITFHLTVPAEREFVWCNYEKIPYHQPYAVKVVSTEPIATTSTRMIYGLNGFEDWGLTTHCAMPAEPGPITE
jgi:hypothetical protein